MITFFQSIFLGLIFCLPLMWAVKLKTDLLIMERKLNLWRNSALQLNHFNIKLKELNDA